MEFHRGRIISIQLLAMKAEDIPKEVLARFNPPFEFKDIADVRIIVKAKGKHYGFIPKEEFTKKQVREIKLAIVQTLLECCDFICPSLEEIKTDKP